MLKLNIIVPAHNEEKRISKTLDEYLAFFKDLKNKKILDFKITVVLNGCKDNTEEVVKRFESNNLKMLVLKKAGKGYAVLEGFKDSLKGDFDFIGFVDADMATSPEVYYSLLRDLNSADVVIASRYLKNSIVDPRQSLERVFASRIYNWLIRSLFLLPYKDTQCGAKIFKRKVIQEIVPNLGMTKLGFDLELIYSTRNKGFKIIESPTIWRDDKYSTINFISSGPWMALAVIRLRLLNSPLKFMIRSYDLLINNLHFLIKGKIK